MVDSITLAHPENNHFAQQDFESFFEEYVFKNNCDALTSQCVLLTEALVQQCMNNASKFDKYLEDRQARKCILDFITMMIHQSIDIAHGQTYKTFYESLIPGFRDHIFYRLNWIELNYIEGRIVDNQVNPTIRSGWLNAIYTIRKKNSDKYSNRNLPVDIELLADKDFTLGLIHFDIENYQSDTAFLETLLYKLEMYMALRADIISHAVFNKTIDLLRILKEDYEKSHKSRNSQLGIRINNLYKWFFAKEMVGLADHSHSYREN